MKTSIFNLKHTWNKCCSDDNVNILALFGKKFHFSFNKFFGHFFSITTLSLSRFL